ncbi:MAG: phosphonate ABC transporter, permease protein PhnE [Verrucomicrobiota bacterium]
MQRRALAAGSVLLLAGFLSPWFKTETIGISGFDIAQAGVGFLFLLPMIALLGLYMTWRDPDCRPLCYMSMSVLSILVMFTLIVIVFNDSEAPLALKELSGSETYVGFTMEGKEHRITSFGQVWAGPYLIGLGAALLMLSPLARRREGIKPKTNAEEAEQVEHVQSLDDLQPPWTLKGDLRKAVITLIAAIVLIYAYVWCGMSPRLLWKNRGNAKDYLFGRQMNETDIAYLEDQMRRAPHIEAQGRAREFQDNKYRGVPYAQQPGMVEKTKEFDRLVEQYLSEMSETEKEQLRKEVERSVLKEKRGGYFPPEIAWPRIQGYLIALLETIAIAIWGTLLAVVFSVPAALLAAENTLRLLVSGDGKRAIITRHAIVFFMRRLLDACRGFNEFVMALIFVAVIGLGPFAGILALWIHTFGILGKVFSEQIEAIDNGQIEALSSTGAAPDQAIVFSVLPQVMPGFVSYALLRFESNVRSATILGFVGAGGIGFLMFDKLNGYLFREVCTMMIIIIAAVGIIDHLCKKLRKQFI